MRRTINVKRCRHNHGGKIFVDWTGCGYGDIIWCQICGAIKCTNDTGKRVWTRPAIMKGKWVTV